MADWTPLALWRRLLALPNESGAKTVAVAVLVSAISAVVVAGTAVTLRPLQEANRAAERQARLDAMIAELPGMADILTAAGADSLETVIVDLRTGAVAEGLDPEEFDLRATALDPTTSTVLPEEVDIAGIGRRPNLSRIRLIKEGGTLRLLILPVYTTGYQSTIYAYLALEGDLNTVAGLSITEQRETPGLGARVQDRKWLDLWPGKKIANERGQIQFSIVRGGGQTVYEVDGITGATRTSNAVASMIRFWLGEHGYGPVLERLRRGEF
jgi:Na+-transporting NADH:ubiquinone oxidoreductase subunit C